MRKIVLSLACLTLIADSTGAAEVRRADVCIYAATPAGIVAAVTAKQEGLDVVLVEPSRWVGGILGAGIKPMQDCPEPRAVGGLTKTKVFVAGNDPPSIRRSFETWLKEENIPIVFDHRVAKAVKTGGRITRVELEHSPPDGFGVPPAEGKPPIVAAIEAKYFIDCSYEGDLMAKAGVSYTYGREPAEKYGEEPAGVGPPTNWRPIDPYVVPGKPESGLLPLIDVDHGKPRGAGDDYTQAYNFRFYVTDDPNRRAPITPPADYDAKKFELVGRYVDYIMQWAGGDVAKATPRLASIFPGWRNSGEYNYQRNSLVTMAPLGISRFYQDGDWPTKSRVWREHIDYLRGLHHFLSTDGRVPEAFRKQTAALGLDRTIHPETAGWPNQLYVRISRRMVGPYVLTHADVLNRTTVDDSIGLALYGVDTYPARRYAVREPTTGVMGTATEGNMFIGGAKGTGKPYAVPYRAITPKAEECANLLVPVCFSATHIAYASARMEPVFCILGESAAVATAQALRADQTRVQDINFAKLRGRLLERGQVLQWTTR
ncbi:MAG: FAD-dependent oxidoreductase [Planctomycetes bacterium]|nr:FAD-dependent oxidoreductase [Planctomycetota bacterium]